MKIKFLLLLALIFILLTGCQTLDTDYETSSESSTTDPYGQEYTDRENNVTTEKLPAYLKYGEKYIKLKEILPYYSYEEDSYSYDLSLVLILDRENLDDKDIHFLTEYDEDDLDVSVYISNKEDTSIDESVELNFLGSFYDEKEIRMYYNALDEKYRNKPAILYSDIFLYVNEPDSEQRNSCYIYNYKLETLDIDKMDSTMQEELTDKLTDKLLNRLTLWQNLLSDE